MVCYHHKDQPAIAICKHCSKAICEQCAIPDEAGFACSEKCHQEIITVKLMMERSKAVYGLKPGRIPIGTLFLIIAGIPFLILGIIHLSAGDSFGFFTFSMGIIFIALGVLSYINQRRSGIRA